MRFLLFASLLLATFSGCTWGPHAHQDGDDSAPVANQPTHLYTPPLEAASEAARIADAIYYFLLGERFLQESQWSLALEAFTKASQADTFAVEPRLLSAHLATQLGDLDKALLFATEVVSLSPGNSKIRLLLAGIHTSRHNYQEALIHYEALLKLEPSNEQARLLTAQIYGKVNRLDKAEEILAPLLKNDGYAWRAYLALGRAHVEQGSTQNAIKPFEEAFRRAPKQLETALALGAAYQETNRAKDAEKIYRKYLKDHPENMVIHTRLGQLLLQRNDKQAALTEFQTIAQLSPDSVQAWLATALIYLSDGQTEEALKNLRLAEAVQPNNTGVRYYLGQTLESMNRDGEAIEQYQRIESGKPFYFESQLRISFLETDSKQGQAAVQRLRRLEESFGDRVELPLAMTIVLLQVKEYQGVVEAATKGLSMDPTQNRLLFHRAMAYDKLEQWPQAERDLQEYIQRVPNDHQALNYLGYSWADRNEHLDQAYLHIKKAVELAPTDGFITDSLGWVLFRLNRLEEALTTMRQAATMEPADPTVQEHLGDVLHALGRTREAVEVWKRSLEIDGNNDKVKEKIKQNEASR